MSWFYQNVIRPSLFAEDSEKIHTQTLAALAWMSRQNLCCDMVQALLDTPALPVRLWSLDFPNPVGLAAGMDKFAAALPAWEAFGFGFAELGGVTWQPQEGNPLPRIFRAAEENALVNRMGFNNPGAEAMAATLAAWKDSGHWPQRPVAINLGKSKTTPLEEANEDYTKSFRALWRHGDFFVVNVSSPNTPNLRMLQDKSSLAGLMRALDEVNTDEASKTGKRPLSKKPVLVKIAPDLSGEELDEIADVAVDGCVAGIVATNTTITRPPAKTPTSEMVFAETGGLSGAPLRERSTEVIHHLYHRTGGTIPIIGVGGIFTAADAWEKITAGASLVQIYTALVYCGPGVVREIVQGLQKLLSENGLAAVADAVGLAHRPRTT